MMVSFCLPHEVDVSALRMLSVLRAFVQLFLMCSAYVSFVSKVRPKIFGLCVKGSAVLSICSEGVVLYSAGSGVNSVVVVFVAFRVRLLVRVQPAML